MPDRIRLQFDFSPDAIERLNKIKELADATCYAEVIRDAVRIYEWYLVQIKIDGSQLKIVKKNGDEYKVQIVLR